MHTSLEKPIPMLDLAAERAAVGPELQAAVLRVLESGRYVLGPDVEAFERDFARYQRAKHGIGLASGTDALLLALKAAGVGPGDLVITSPFTFFASAATIAWLGARPVLVDVEPDTALIDAAGVARAIDSRVRAVLPVHLYGQLADVMTLRKLCDRAKITLIEDAAQAHGAERDGRRAGELGEFAAFSFYPTKNLGCAGDGGLVTTGDDAQARRLRTLRDHGSPTKYHHVELGLNSRLDALQAALLAVKLPHLEAWNHARARIAAIYDRGFAGNENVRPLSRAPKSSPVYHQYTVRIGSGRRDAVQAGLAAKGISTAIHYPRPVHLQPAAESWGYPRGSLPNAEALADEVLCLPIHPFLQASEAERVVAEVSREASRS
jgi:dTDP-4-amino-4,6-dideoxygalactose transaminase